MEGERQDSSDMYEVEESGEPITADPVGRRIRGVEEGEKEWGGE